MIKKRFQKRSEDSRAQGARSTATEAVHEVRRKSDNTVAAQANSHSDVKPHSGGRSQHRATPRTAIAAVSGNAFENDIPAVDWQGNAIDCTTCAHQDRLALGACSPLRACVHDRYAKRIDRFFGTNPGLASLYIDHPYFEVRAVAAKYLDLFQLNRLMNDLDETVRASVALRLPPKLLIKLIHDPDREVRVRVALRIDTSELTFMLRDPDYYVRLVVARRIAPGLLFHLVRDPDSTVRREVATRIGNEWLAMLANDSDEEVRLCAIRRMPAGLLPPFRFDHDWRIRFEVAQRVSDEYLNDLAKDEDEAVAAAALERLHPEQEHHHGY